MSRTLLQFCGTTFVETALHTFILFQMPSRNSGFVHDLSMLQFSVHCILSSHISMYTSYLIGSVHRLYYIALVL